MCVCSRPTRAGSTPGADTAAKASATRAFQPRSSRVRSDTVRSVALHRTSSHRIINPRSQADPIDYCTSYVTAVRRLQAAHPTDQAMAMAVGWHYQALGIVMREIL